MVFASGRIGVYRTRFTSANNWHAENEMFNQQKLRHLSLNKH